MRIATSTIYSDQTASIDALSAQYQSIGQDLSTGKSLNVPSDDPSQISQDLTLTNTINQENSDASNAVAAQNALTFTDSTLSSLTNLLQTARSLAVEGATDIIPNGSQRPLIGKQVSGLLNQALALANQQYGNTYIFAGTGSANQAPITPLGSPVNGVAFTGNNQARTELINGQEVQVGTTMQAAFNQGSTNGTPSVFQLLTTLQNTMDQEPASIESQKPITVTNDTITGAADATQTTLGLIAGPPAPMTTVPLTADSTGNYSIEIDGTDPVSGAAGSATFTFGPTTPVDDGTANSVVGAINAQTGTTGVTASWNVASQRLQLTSVANGSPPFLISDVPSPAGATIIAPPPPAAVGAAATNTSNFLEAFQIPNQVSVTSNLSTQIGDIDAVINQVLSARAQIGQQIQNLAGTSSQLQVLSNDNVTTQGTIQDTNIAQATSQFTLVQTALQGAYATTTRLEGKTLIDYL
jgi:flagellar hook-associated protein 3 FlgL